MKNTEKTQGKLPKLKHTVNELKTVLLRIESKVETAKEEARELEDEATQASEIEHRFHQDEREGEGTCGNRTRWWIKI